MGYNICLVFRQETENVMLLYFSDSQPDFNSISNWFRDNSSYRLWSSSYAIADVCVTNNTYILH